MIAVVQRVSHAAVSVAGAVVGQIGKGLVVLLGVAHDDTEADSSLLAQKIANLRIFQDEQEKMNLSVAEIGGALLVISQFTLLADCRKGRRPSFHLAAPPEQATRLYEHFLAACSGLGLPVAHGIFQAMMLVEIHNDGPVTLIVDSLNRKGNKPKSGEEE